MGKGSATSSYYAKNISDHNVACLGCDLNFISLLENNKTLFDLIANNKLKQYPNVEKIYNNMRKYSPNKEPYQIVHSVVHSATNDFLSDQAKSHLNRSLYTLWITVKKNKS